MGNEKTVEHESYVYTDCNLCSWESHQKINKETRGLENKRKSEDYQNYCITEIGQNTEKSPGDLRRLAVTHSGERPSTNAYMKNSMSNKNK